jgi:hypothetical protein
VRAFARRKPSTFLVGAAIVGVVAGRLTRALAAGDTSTTTAPGGRSTDGLGNGRSFATPVDEEYLVPPPTPATAPPVAPTTPPPPMPTPAVPDLDPGAPVTPRFGPGSGN